jgi:outer membrane protein TolC
MGVGPDFCLRLGEEALPAPEVKICREQIIELALSRRGELVQAGTAAEVVQLEVDAQGRTYFPTARTFAAVVDIHSRPVPQGSNDRNYRPGAVGPEMPTTLAGPRSARVERASNFSARAAAVVEKTRNLIALEAEDAYLRWAEAAQKIPPARGALTTGRHLAESTREGFNSGSLRIEEVLTNEALVAQAKSTYNEALFQQILALTALQRITAGGFDPGWASQPAGRP